MAFRGKNHGGNGQTAKQVKAKQDAYIAARIGGATQNEAKEVAGYSPQHRPERDSATVRNRILDELDARGMDESWMAQEYLDALNSAKRGDEKDFQGIAKLLLQISYLRGHGKRETPAVALQINNSGTGGAAIAGDPSGVEPGRVRELADRTLRLLEVVEAERRDRELSRLPDGRSGDNEGQEPHAAAEARP